MCTGEREVRGDSWNREPNLTSSIKVSGWRRLVVRSNLVLSFLFLFLAVFSCTAFFAYARTFCIPTLRQTWVGRLKCDKSEELVKMPSVKRSKWGRLRLRLRLCWMFQEVVTRLERYWSLLNRRIRLTTIDVWVRKKKKEKTNKTKISPLEAGDPVIGGSGHTC